MPEQNGTGVDKVTVEVIKADDTLDIVVTDAGRGFDPAHLESSGSGGFGLSNIRQRVKFMGEV